MELVLRLIIAAVLALAGIGKAANLRRFAKVIRQFRLVSTDAPALALAVAVTATELALALTLAAGALVEPAGWAAATLFVLFAIVLAVMLSRNDTGQIGCGCFGGNAPISWNHVVRNVVLSALAVAAAEPRLRGAAVFVAVALLVTATAMRPRAVAAAM